MAIVAQSARRRLEQERAAFALGQIDRVPEAARGKFGRLARRLPAMILHNGFGQTLAFHLADAKGNSTSMPAVIVLGLSEWLINYRHLYDVEAPIGLRTLIDAVVQEDSARYRRARHEALALAEWLKRFAEAFLPEDDA